MQNPPAVSRRLRLDGPAAGVLLVFVLVTVALLLRMPELLFNPSLWAEDSDRFIGGFVREGLASVAEPVHGAGYHQLFERLVAAALLLVPLRHAEVLFHLVSLAVLYLAAAAIWFLLPTKSVLARLTACLALMFVPVDPSTLYLALVNTQWILAPVTMLLIVTDHVTSSRFKAAWCAALAVLCLTGPFAVMALPVILARMALFRDFKRERMFYLSMLVPIALQVVALSRHAAVRLAIEASDSLKAWHKGVVENTLLTFMPGRVMLALFGVFLGIVLWRLVRDKGREAFAPLALLVLAIINLAAGFYSYRNMPELMGPLTIGERYFFVPFTLLFFFLLTAADGILRPIAIAFIGVACFANAMPIAGGPAGRGPNHWRSQVDAARFFPATSVLVRPNWEAQSVWKVDLVNLSPAKAPVEIALDAKRLQVPGLKASAPAPGVLRLVDAGESRDLLNGTWEGLGPDKVGDPVREAIVDGQWYGRNVAVVPMASGVKDVTLQAGVDNELYHAFGGVEQGGLLTFSFEARSDTRFTLSPHVTDYRAGVSYLAEIGQEWKSYAFDFQVKPGITKRGGVYLTWHTGVAGRLQVRNVRATLAARHQVLVEIPAECDAHPNVALTYTAVGARGTHRFDALADRDRVDEWQALHRYMENVTSGRVLVAFPNQRLRWLRITLLPPLEMRETTLRCY